MRNIILTGIPRAGTTLAAAKLDAMPDTVCLNEPEWQRPHPALNAMQFAKAIAEDFSAMREKFLDGDPVPDRRAPDGSALTNYYDPGMNFVTYPLVRHDLSENFTLAIKHNAPYLAILPQLIALGVFEIQAVIRHPLPVLRSWRRLNLPVSRGELPAASAYWPEMRSLTQSNTPLLEKQVAMFDLMLDRLLEHRARITLLPYEEFAGSFSATSSQETAEDEAIMTALKKHAPKTAEFYSLK